MMLASWGVLLPTGALIPRFLKPQLSGGRWFRLHRGLQSVGLIVSLVGVVIALWHRGGVGTAHGYLGLAVMSLGILQPLNAFFRPHPTKKGEHKTHARKLWEIMHMGSGWAALAMAAVTIFLGIPLYSQASGSLPLSLFSSLTLAEAVGYFGYGAILLIFLLFSLVMCCCGGAPRHIRDVLPSAAGSELKSVVARNS